MNKKTNEKPQSRFLIAANKQIKLSVQIPQKVSDLIADYRDFHKELSAQEATLDSLVSAFISAALTSDKSFIKWRREKAEQASPKSSEGQINLLEVDSYTKLHQ